MLIPVSQMLREAKARKEKVQWKRCFQGPKGATGELERGFGPEPRITFVFCLIQNFTVTANPYPKNSNTHPVQHPLSTRPPTGLPFWCKWFSTYKPTNMLTEMAFPQENIQMSSSIKLQNRSAYSCLTCTWVSLTTGHPSVHEQEHVPLLFNYLLAEETSDLWNEG